MSERDRTGPEAVFSRRMMIAGGAGALIWTGLIARFAQLQLIEGDAYRDIADENSLRRDLDPPMRGTILDRFGRSLAAHRKAGRVSLVREQVDDVDATLLAISQFIELPEARRERIARQARRNPPFVPTLVAAELSYEDFAKMSLHAAQLPGVLVEMGAIRSYPFARDFAHVMGYVARASQKDLVRLIHAEVEPALGPQQRALLEALPLDGSLHPLHIGQRLPEGSDARRAWEATRQRLTRLYLYPDMRTGRSGIEFVCDRWLRGEEGVKAVEVNAAGRIMREVPEEHRPPVPGKDVTITIDSDLQRAAIERFGEESGAAVVMDIESGDILALVSTPAFDPNDFVNGISQADYDVLRQNDRAPLYHKAYDGIYPPGSTFKMVVATAALEAGVIDPRERVYCGGRYRFGNRTWSCWKKEGHGRVDMHEGIKQSCDTYFYEVAKRTGIEKIAEVSRRFGFGQSWALGMTGGARGVVPNDAWKRETIGEPWFEGETLNIGIGQGYMTSTPLQLCLMTAKIASEGKPIAPRLVVEGPDLPQPDQLDGRFDPEIMRRMKAAMYGVTSEARGTALRSGDLGLGGPRMAGKTGTAQVRYISQAERARGVIENEDLPRHLRDHALFVGYAPADAPKYAVAVIVEHGGSGSRAAGPVARDIMAAAIQLNSRRQPAPMQTAAADAGNGHTGGGL